MADEILSDIKQALGLSSDYAPFDKELIMFVNSVISTLKQLNVGPESGLVITATTPWSSLLAEDLDHELENVKMYIFMKVKLVFDSSGMSAHLLNHYDEMIKELEWRINHSANPPAENMQPEEVVTDA